MGGGSDQQSTQQSQQVTQLPPWVNQAAQQNYAFAQNVANRPLQQYQGQMVADIGPQTQQAWNLAAGGNDASNAAYAGVLNAKPGDLRAYINPYTQDVINKTLPIMQQNLALSQNQQQNQANTANAFGGSRMAIQQGVTQAQGAQNMAQMAAQLNQANFAQAQQARQAQEGLNMQAGAGLARNQLQQFGQLQTAGAQEQAQAQNQIQAQLQKFQQAWGYPTQQLGALQSALGMTPYGQATQGQTTTQTQTAANPMGEALGAMQMLGGLFSAPVGGVSAAGGLMNLINSDRRLKTDISRVDTHPTGLPVYAYRYKGDPKSYPKVVGPMAEDVQKIAPQAVQPIGVGGRLAVHMPTLDAMSPPGMPAPMPGSLPKSARLPGLERARTPVPGPLSSPGAAGTIGPLGAAMRAPPRGMGGRRARPPPLRGALGG